jgi:hypothetical protein
MEEICISIDTEFESSNVIDGNCLQLGFVAFRLSDELLMNDDWIVDKLSICFKDQGKKKEESCLKFWNEFPLIYERIIKEAEDISLQMLKLKNWLNELSGRYKIVNFIADYSCIDFPWFRNLFLTHCNLTEEDEFQLPYKCICVASMIHTLEILGHNKKKINEYCKCSRYEHTHYALDDAIEGAYYYLKLREYIRLNVLH